MLDVAPLHFFLEIHASKVYNNYHNSDNDGDDSDDDGGDGDDNDGDDDGSSHDRKR